MQGICNTAGQVQVTGLFAECVYAPYMTFDMSGNVSEIIDAAGLTTTGGSYADTASANLSCTQEPKTASPSTRVGFRCCAEPRP